MGPVAHSSAAGLSAASHLRPDKAATSEERQHALTVRMRSLVTAVEEVVSARRGVVHSIAGDFIFVSWNIVAPCRDSEVSGFTAALQLARRFGDSVGGISISLSASPVIAGNFDANGQRTPVILGPAHARCEKLEMLNYHLGTRITLDEAVARGIRGAPLLVQDVCVMLAAVYRCGVDAEKGPFQIAYGVYPSAVRDRHTAWVSMFREFPTMLLAGRVDEMLGLIAAYRTTHLRAATVRPGGSAGQRSASADAHSDLKELAKTTELWDVFLSNIKARGCFKDVL